MLVEFIKAFFMAGIPVGAAAYLMVWWAIRSQYLERTTDMKTFEKSVKRLSERRSGKKKKNADGEQEAEEKPRLNPVHNKWLAFGGGFYGLVATITFVIVEIGEVWDFLGNLADSLRQLADFSLDMVISFFINSLMNFFTALAWPVYWIPEVRGEFWIWFLAAYAGYWLGVKAALNGQVPIFKVRK